MAAEPDEPYGWPLGCQMRPWMVAHGGPARFNPQALGLAMRDVHAIGFSGYEANLASLPLGDPVLFAQVTDEAGDIELCGAHVGGPWWDESGTARAVEVLAQAGQLRELGCRRLVVSLQSPPPDISRGQLGQLVQSLSLLGRTCRESADVHVAFHNHAPEVADDAQIVNAIVDGCAPEDVSLGADLGWVAYGGFDVVEFIERFSDRLTYLHLKDLAEDEDGGHGFTEVGRGILYFTEILQALAKKGYDGWLTAETDAGRYWRGYDDPVRSACAQFDGLRSLIGGRNPGRSLDEGRIVTRSDLEE